MRNASATEVRLDDDLDPSGFGIHPHLLQAALDPVLGPDDWPLTWSGTRLHRTGARAVSVRFGTGEDWRHRVVETGAIVRHFRFAQRAKGAP